MIRRFFFPTFVGLLILGGCISPVKFQKSGIDTAPDWQHVSSSSTASGLRVESSSSTVIDQDWWEHFNDPTLSALIAEAIKNNKSLAMAKARVEEARAQRGLSRSILMPQIDAVASGSRGNFGINSSNRIINQGQAGFNASWEADLFGANQSRSAQAQALFQSAQAAEQAVMVGLLAEVARTYFDFRNYQAQLGILQENLANQQRTYGLTVEQFNGAIASDFDVQRAGAQVSKTQSDIPLFQSAYDASLNRINVLLGYPPGTKDALLVSTQTFQPLNSDVLVAAPVTVLANRPDIRVAERQLAATISGRRASISDFFPKISLLGFFGVQTWDHVLYHPWDIGASAVMPLLHFGELRSQYKIASARQKQAFYNYQQTVLQALENMEDSLSSFLHESDRNQVLNTEVTQDRKAETYAHQQFEEGFVGLLDVLIAQREVLLAESGLADSDTQLRKKLVDIYAAAGGGWDTKLAKK